MIEWLLTAWLVVGPAAGPMTYGFTDKVPCDLWREELLKSRVPLMVGDCERGDDKEYGRRTLGFVPNPYGPTVKGSAGFGEIVGRGLWIGPTK